MAIVLAAALLVVFGGNTAGARAQAVVPDHFQEKAILNGLTVPTNVEFAPDGRVFVAEKAGIIKVFDSIDDTSGGTVFADLREKVFNGWDRGLLGLALPPDFTARPRVYVSYTYNGEMGGTYPKWPSQDGDNDNCPDPPGANNAGCVVSGRVSVLTPPAQAGDPVTERVLVEDWCQQFPSHSIGTIAFGRDGMLYAGGGDGASYQYVDYGQKNNACGDPPSPAGTPLTVPNGEGGALRSQDLRTPADPTTLDGGIIRVDPETGKAAAGNPTTTGDDNARRLVVEGARNPFRFTLRPGTDELWIGDVGYVTWEEINRVPDPKAKVTNLGWPCYEGAGRQAGYDGADLKICENLYTAGATAVVAPYFTYRHSDKIVPNEPCTTGSSATSGMAFYTGTTYPAAYQGALFFTDYSRGCVWAMKTTGGQPDKTNIETFASGTGSIVELQAGPNGDIFGVDIAGGRIVRYVYNGVNNPPVAAIKSDVNGGPLPLTVQFDGTASTDADGEALTYSWDLDGDGTYGDSTDPKPTKTYTSSGRIKVGLKVSDGHPDGTDTVTQEIFPGSTPPVASIDSPAEGTTWTVGDTITYSGSATDAEDGPLTGDKLKWQIIMHHCPSDCHKHVITGTSGPDGSFVAPDHEYPSWIELVLTATDSSGEKDVRSIELHPKTTDLTLATSPTGFPVTLLDTTKAAPLTKTVITGSTVSISAPTTTQWQNQQVYQFAGWSDGKPSAHNVTAPDTATTFTATFKRKTNLALKRPVKASSVEKTGFEAAKAVDGSMTTRWSSKFASPQWLQVDLGASKKVGLVLLRWETAFGKDYKIQVSADGTTWTTAATRTNGNGALDVVNFTPRNTRYVRMYGTARGTKYGYSLWEFEVYDG